MRWSSKRMDFHKQERPFPSFVPRFVTALGLLPTTEFTWIDSDGRRKIKAVGVLHVTYWICCFMFFAVQISSSIYVAIMAVARPQSDNPFLKALIEISFACEVYRGDLFCMYIILYGKKGVQVVIRQTEALINRFALTKAEQRRIRAVTFLLATVTLCVVASISAASFTRWMLQYAANGMTIVPYFTIPVSVAVPLQLLFTSIPELLLRLTVVLAVGAGLVLLACLKVTRRKLMEGNFGLESLKNAHREYYAIANGLFCISQQMGELLAFSLLFDLVPICGRVTHFFFAAPPVPDVVRQGLTSFRNYTFIVSGIGFYIFTMYSPFVMLHREACKLHLQLLAEKRKVFDAMAKKEHHLTELNNFLQAFEEQPLALTLVPGFQIRENFTLLIATLLGSYTFICYQLLKETSTDRSKEANSKNCTVA
ncbi:hypothetical protein BV898_15410 [Hypsibius exemplaris]|uniref:Uncharacterized protein n=1 Tax=Hypsibius exemplaris TaxID=2072580 RepID=A0A9X6NCS6_HYPEX|nr:hypothetical protein BV898_15410 [Hypsibius exemplaris]